MSFRDLLLLDPTGYDQHTHLQNNRELKSAVGELQDTAGLSTSGVAGAWSTYTPVLKYGGVAWTIGNGTATGRWQKTSGLVSVAIQIVWGSTSSGSAGNASITLPANMQIDRYHPVGTALYWDDSATSAFLGLAVCNTAAAQAGEIQVRSTSAHTIWTLAAPVAPAQNDRYELQLSYEGA